MSSEAWGTAYTTTLLTQHTAQRGMCQKENENVKAAIKFMYGTLQWLKGNGRSIEIKLDLVRFN